MYDRIRCWKAVKPASRWVFTSPSALKTTKLKKQLEIWHPNSHKTNPYIIRFFFCWPKFSKTKKINCPINPSFISSHLISPSLSNPTVFYSPCYTPLGVPGFHPWEVFPTPPFSLPGFRNLEFQDVHLSYRPSKRGEAIGTREGRLWMDLYPLDPWRGPVGFSFRFSFDGRFLGVEKSFPNHRFRFFFWNLPKSQENLSSLNLNPLQKWWFQRRLEISFAFLGFRRFFQSLMWCYSFWCCRDKNPWKKPRLCFQRTLAVSFSEPNAMLVAVVSRVKKLHLQNVQSPTIN